MLNILYSSPTKCCFVSSVSLMANLRCWFADPPAPSYAADCNVNNIIMFHFNSIKYLWKMFAIILALIISWFQMSRMRNVLMNESSSEKPPLFSAATSYKASAPLHYYMPWFYHVCAISKSLIHCQNELAIFYGMLCLKMDKKQFWWFLFGIGTRTRGN